MTTTIGSLDLNAFNDLYNDSNQYFWFESDSSATYGAGAHVTLVPDTTFISNPTGQNILMNTDGISIRNGLLPMMTLDNNSLDFNIVDTVGNTYTNAASFGISSTIGLTDGTQSYLYVDYHSMQMIDPNGNLYLYVSDLRDANGEYNAVDTFTGNGTNTTFNISMTYKSITSVTIDDVAQTEGVDYTRSGSYSFIFTTAPISGAIISISYVTGSTLAKAYTFGLRSSGSKVAPMSFAEGYLTTASNNEAHAEGYHSTASGQFSHAENWYSTASGQASHAEGYYSSARGQASHAEGWGPTASGHFSHAEGYNTIARGRKSHAENHGTTASGEASHAEGCGTVAYGVYSHAQNERTLASKDSQTALGTYNIEDASSTTTHPSALAGYGEYSVIIGNGTDDSNRSNALTVDWNGNVVCAGGLTLNGNKSVANYVVEKGTATAGSVTWEYRKWADGTLEMWGRGLTTLNINTAVGNIYTTAGEYDIAVPSFVDSVDFVTGELSGGGWVDVTVFNVPPKIRLYAPTAYTSANRHLRYYLKGTWS